MRFSKGLDRPTTRAHMHVVILPGSAADIRNLPQVVVVDVGPLASAMCGLGDSLIMLRDAMGSTALQIHELGCPVPNGYLEKVERRKVRERQFWGHGKRKGSKAIPHW